MSNPRTRPRQQLQQQLEFQKKQAKAERVRKLWTEFEQWSRPPRNEMERERDQLLFHTGNVNSAAAKTSRRKIEEAHFFKAREEWQRRLRAADLKESDWDPMNEAEMKAVEEALGVDDEEGYITDPSPSPPHRPVFSSAASSSSSSSSTAPIVPAENKSNPGSSASSLIAPLTAPPMTTASRTTSSASSSYECVRPEEFHSDDDESISDSEFSTFSTTISSIISEEDEVVAPVTEYMFTQALEVAKDNGPLIARSVFVTSPSKPAEPATSGPPPPAPPKRPPDAKLPQLPISKTSSSSSSSSAAAAAATAAAAAQKVTSSPPSPPQNITTSASTSSSSSSGRSSSKHSRVNYPLVAPSLSDLSDYDDIDNEVEADSKRLSPSLVAQFEAQFEARKLQIRMEKIREFHQLACDADIELCVNIANGRRGRTLSRQEEKQLVDEHYQRTVSLRERMEKDRKEQVNAEKKQMREEFSRRSYSSSSSSSSSSQRLGGLRQQQLLLLQQQQQRSSIPPPAESESEDDMEDEIQKKLERMRQEQIALQAKYGSHEPQQAQQTMTRKRAATLTRESAPGLLVGALNDKKLDESNDEVSTPRPAPKAPGSAWSIKPSPSATRSLANVLNQNLSRKECSQFELVDHSQLVQDTENVNIDPDSEDSEQEKESTGFWSYLKKKATAPPPPPPPTQSPWNFSGVVQKSPQKAQNTKSRLGIVTSAWDDDFGAGEQEPLADEDAGEIVDKEVEQEEAPQDKTPVIPSAPAPNVPMNRKQTKKQRLATKKAAVASAVPAATAKSEAPAPALSTQKAQQSKTAPVAVPAKAGKKGSLADNDDISSTPKPSVLKRIQAQLANEDMLNEREDDTPTTPRPAPANKKGAVQSNNPWAGKGVGKTVVDPTFDDGVTESMDTTSSRPMLDQMNGKKNGDAASSPQVPGSWKWSTPSSDKRKSQPEPAAVVGSRKNSSARQAASSAAVNGGETDSVKKRGKRPQRSAHNDNDAWGKRTTIEEVPDNEGDNLFSVSQSDNLPYDSRYIIQERDTTFEELEQPRIHEPRPSKPRTMYDNIIQYGEAAADPGLVSDLRGELPWSDERIAKALADMTQHSAEMAKKVNGHPHHTSALAVGAVNGIGMSGTAGVNVNGGGFASMNSPASANGFATSRPSAAAAAVETSHTAPKQVRWQPASVDPARSGSFGNKMVPRSYEDEAFSPLAANPGISGFPYGAVGAKTNGAAPGWPGTSGRNQFSGNPLDADPEGDELARAARNLMENIQVSVSSQQRNKPGFAAV